ncbi:glutamate receptor 2.1-like [Dorcoceras hygrometricum]|uniref:Glutamate receptor 2.1-like n=1 Tax=Dorcoceras hygrometricum TaxID=472368 RepID=A0A2Z7B832_9LAMI|nr:glutamate receptor 2.1-like [Dorcoceras hygrometricum]
MSFSNLNSSFILLFLLEGKGVTFRENYLHCLHSWLAETVTERLERSFRNGNEAYDAKFQVITGAAMARRDCGSERRENSGTVRKRRNDQNINDVLPSRHSLWY